MLTSLGVAEFGYGEVDEECANMEMGVKIELEGERKRDKPGKLSPKANIDVKIIRRIYRNPVEIITAETLDKLATVLEVNVCDLIEQVSIRRPAPIHQKTK